MATQDVQSEVNSQTQTLNYNKGAGNPTIYQRVNTALRSFWILRGLTAEQVDSFMNSYVIYDLDWKDEKKMIEVLGPDYQKKVGDCLQDYYRVLNHLCAIGELEKMYVPPVLDLDAGITRNQVLYEESIADELQLPPNPKLLDLGCGRGRVAAHMTEMVGAQVTGINIDNDQIASAIAYNKQMGYSNEFIRGDFNDLPLPLPDNHFDGFYQIQAFSLCKDIPALCKEIYRVLKPGARLSLLDWASLDAYDPEDPHHQELMRAVKPIIGAVGTPTPQSLKADLESAGFNVIRHGNDSIDGLQVPLLERARVYFSAAKITLLSLVRLMILPAHFKTLFERMTKDSEAFLEADKSKLITTCYHWSAQKPAEGAFEPESGSATSKSTSPASLDSGVQSESSASSREETPAKSDKAAEAKL